MAGPSKDPLAGFPGDAVDGMGSFEDSFSVGAFSPVADRSPKSKKKTAAAKKKPVTGKAKKPARSPDPPEDEASKDNEDPDWIPGAPHPRSAPPGVPEALSEDVEVEATPVVEGFGRQIAECLFSKTYSLREYALSAMAEMLTAAQSEWKVRILRNL
jgi:hypothetical protein